MNFVGHFEISAFKVQYLVRGENSLGVFDFRPSKFGTYFGEKNRWEFLIFGLRSSVPTSGRKFVGRF